MTQNIKSDGFDPGQEGRGPENPDVGGFRTWVMEL